MNISAEEEAIIRKRYVTQAVSTAVNVAPPFKKLAKK